MKIIHKRTECIGCGLCASLCKWFEMIDGIARLKGGVVEEKKDHDEMIISEDEACVKEAIEICPVDCISSKE